MQNSLNVSADDTKNLTVLSKQTVLDKDFTVYGTAENPLFLAKDVAEWIEYAKTGNGDYDVSSMLKSVDEDEKVQMNTTNIFRSKGNPNKWFLTEDGLYEVLMLSTKPIAKQFKKEVKKILHQIRITGGYTVPRTFADALRLAAEQQAKIELMQPKAEYFDDYMDSTNLFEIGHLGKDTKIGEQKIFKKLKSDGVIKARYSTDGIKSYDPCYGYEQYFESVPRPFAKGDKIATRDKLMLNAKGYAYFKKKYSLCTLRDKLSDPEYMKKATEAAADKFIGENWK